MHIVQKGVIARIASVFFKKGLIHSTCFFLFECKNKFKRFLFLTVERILRTKYNYFSNFQSEKTNQFILLAYAKKGICLENAIDTNTIGEDKDLEKP
ncbi:MAG: hypothetical protein CM15mP121_0750 [Bacteroidota bacterium]|nr:MAG: hypothetical protein CM15mP121_0750 [Bacteroidota bacterium]